MKYLSLFFLLSVFGCSSINFTDANKVLVKKGVKQGNEIIEYSVLINSEQEFTIEKLSIEGSSESLDYYYKNLENGASSYRKLKPFPKGNYSLHFKISETKNINKEEFLIINYTVNNNQRSKKLSIGKKKDKFLR